MTILFLANLDAERELEDAAYRRPAAMRSQILMRAASLCEDLARAYGAEPRLVLDGDEPSSMGDEPAALAWCATPRALATLAEWGHAIPAPPVEILRAVNHRAFGIELVQTAGLPSIGERWVGTVEECEAMMVRAPQQRFVLKRAFGFAGRARKVLVAEGITPSVRTWMGASMVGEGGGLLVEPFVHVELDVSIHGAIDELGRLSAGQPMVFANDSRGGFVGARRPLQGEMSRLEIEALVEARDRVAAALWRAGYIGPFGIDGFRWRDDGGVLRFRPLVEINARHTMAYWRGMAE